ncbi:hypothetical protein CH63R_02460 [Colletotrichum higginsianum IMI 349063]|uniref:Uncharacterized protein n=2 Tax=Colletotrichum higginsianum TaxID=80884 RepID=A0A1B7YP59_COLHI|nr:hypothetical protein CH63R_02460 [Colletotrichum higginsianum IMI 349063]OBR13734.1 hypothetical protein CH63R_02460 [Colletotrichum higginsianum IMI 349063]TID02718.1 hypothetical protein CH35J_003937 [Colletotrichum higginsianum]GJC95602.1 hypothetical protein ColKHC_04428 [Colletotrichum higginsianum]
MPSIQNLITRDASSGVVRRDDDGSNMLNLMIVVLALVFFALLLVSTLFLMRRIRKQQRQEAMLPTYQEVKGGGARNHHNLTIQTSQDGRSSVLYIGQDGRSPMLQNPQSAPHSPDNVPEIHITFPDEQDEGGRRKSGRVLVVRVGDGGSVGLEPVRDEQLPAYEKDSKSQFYSVDMDSIGGLREKERFN